MVTFTSTRKLRCVSTNRIIIHNFIKLKTFKRLAVQRGFRHEREGVSCYVSCTVFVVFRLVRVIWMNLENISFSIFCLIFNFYVLAGKGLEQKKLCLNA